MKKLLHVILKYYLNVLARIVLLRCRPTVIAIAGSANKTFFKQAVTAALATKGLKSASTFHAFNTEIGLPLTILGLRSGYESYARWLRIVPRALRAAWKRRLPSMLVLELGADHAGDMGYLTRLTKPTIAIITGLTRRYLENFGSIASAVGEYKTLVRSIPKHGFVIANHDSVELQSVAEESAAPVFFFSLDGSSEKNIYTALNLSRNQDGITGKYASASGTHPFSINRFGDHHVQAFLAGQLLIDNLHVTDKIR